VPRLGTLCFHPSLLPRYRGGSAIPWQLINGETRTGVTVFWTDAGIDTGPILLQREATAGPDDTAGSLYYQTLFPLGVQVCLDAVALVRAGDPPRVPQDEKAASYDPLLTDAHAAVDWRGRRRRSTTSSEAAIRARARIRRGTARRFVCSIRAASRGRRAAPRARSYRSTGRGSGSRRATASSA
jgi:methionyl-tRNA formyltransferase